MVLHGSWCDGTGRSPTVGFNGRYWHPAATSNSHSDSRIKIPPDADRGREREKRRREWRVSFPLSPPLPPCESAPVWHRGQFQSTQRCGVSITQVAGRSKILLSSLASTFGGASIQTWAKCMISSLITVLYSISRRKNLLTCRLALHSAVASSRPRNYPNSFSMAVRSATLNRRPSVRFVERAKPK